MRFRLIDIGISEYQSAYTLQKECVRDVKSERANAFLILTEHRPILTLGRNADRKNLLVDSSFLEGSGIDIISTDRGGDITFHGPGQLVAYPILDISRMYRDIHRYLRDLEETIIRTLGDFRISSGRLAHKTGVWFQQEKIASIGIGVSNWVSFHGFAINANVNLSYFDMIHPCGIKGIRVTSMKESLGKEISMPDLKGRVVLHFCDIFHIDSTSINPSLKSYSTITVPA